MMFVKPNVVLVSDEGKVKYNVPMPNGVYIQHIDGKLYTEDSWTSGGFSNDEANGVAVMTDKVRFVIAKKNVGAKAWSSNTSTLVDGLATYSFTTASTDFAGYNNTQLMLATDTSGAGYSCANFTFPNGQKGYLPAMGEWSEAYANKSKIDSLMTKIGGAALRSSNYWSSTQYSSSSAFAWYWYNGSMDYNTKSYTSYYVRAFTVLTL